MANRRLTMRKIKEILRLYYGLNFTRRQIARSLSISHTTVNDLIYRAEAAKITWPLPEDLDETTLEARLYPGNQANTSRRPEPDMALVHRELKRKGVTLQLLWFEYKGQHPDGYQYSQFCERYREFCGHLDVVMRQSHRAGEKMFVDYAGQTVPIVDPVSGKISQAQIFVAVLGASNYTFAEATPAQDLFSFIGSHCRAFTFFGGVPEVIVPDNLKSGVKSPSFYEPDLNPTYQDMAAHYGAAVIPARPKKPRDKSKVEVGVQVVERWILAVLRNRTFFSIAELNQAIREALLRLNQKPFKKLAGSRQSIFETIEKPALKPLPATRYEFARWKKARVNIDYHVEVEKNYYSVPYQLVRREVDVRFTGATVEVFHKGQRVASHPRSYSKGQYLTERSHMPVAHQKYLEWSPDRLINWAGTVGPQTARLVKTLLEAKRQPEQGFRSCLGILRLGKLYSPERLEAAARRALSLGASSYKSIKSILENGLDKLANEEGVVLPPVTDHPNLRGSSYYQEEEGVGLTC